MSRYYFHATLKILLQGSLHPAQNDFDFHKQRSDFTFPFYCVEIFRLKLTLDFKEDLNMKFVKILETLDSLLPHSLVGIADTHSIAH